MRYECRKGGALTSSNFRVKPPCAMGLALPVSWEGRCRKVRKMRHFGQQTWETPGQAAYGPQAKLLFLRHGSTVDMHGHASTAFQGAFSTSGPSNACCV